MKFHWNLAEINLKLFAHQAKLVKKCTMYKTLAIALRTKMEWNINLSRILLSARIWLNQVDH